MMYMRPYVSLIVVFQKKKTATNVYIKKKITKIVKKNILIHMPCLPGTESLLTVRPLLPGQGTYWW